MADGLRSFEFLIGDEQTRIAFREIWAQVDALGATPASGARGAVGPMGPPGMDGLLDEEGDDFWPLFPIGGGGGGLTHPQVMVRVSVGY